MLFSPNQNISSVKLISHVLPSLKGRILISEIFCWNGSEVVLCPIKGKKKTWKPLVEKRVILIRKDVDMDKWIVRVIDNPANTFIRFCSDNDLKGGLIVGSFCVI